MDRLAYHLRLAWRDVRRNRGLSWAIFAGLTLAAAIWTTAIAHYLRFHGPFPALSPHLHQVELEHPRPGAGAWMGEDDVALRLSRTQVSYPEYQLLAGSGIPQRQTGSVRARVLISPDALGPARSAAGRFVGADFFAMFRLPLQQGLPFSAEEERQGAAVVVLGKTLHRQLFGGGAAVGRTVLIEGHPFRVVGVLARHQPARPVWDVAYSGAPQDGLYLPFSWWQRLLARPSFPLTQATAGGSFQQLLRSPTVFVSYWLELPTAESKRGYRAHLDRHFGGNRRPAYVLRDYAAWKRTFAIPYSDVRFFTMLTGLVLLGGGFNASRLLLAKGLARKAELGIHRALGASRLAIFVRQMLEAAALAGPAALLGTLLSIPYNDVFNRLVKNNDIPVQLTVDGLVRGFIPALLVGLASAVYPAWRLSRTGPTVRMGKHGLA